MRFEVDIKELPEQIDTSTYSKFSQVHVIFHPFLINLTHLFVLLD